jgi:hypothetical protein
LITHVCNDSIAAIFRHGPDRDAMPPLNALAGWALAVAALAAGFAAWGGPGVLLALSVVVFWLLLQFSRALRAMRLAGSRPLGALDNAVMLNARLQRGMPLTQVIALTHSLGLKVEDDPETYAWADAAGDSVRVQFRNGRCSAWALQRAGTAAA